MARPAPPLVALWQHLAEITFQNPDETHLVLWLAAANAVIEALRGEPRLTPRQLAIADLVTRGFSNVEVATALAISENTVKKQLKDVYRRLEVANRTELAHVLRR